MRISLLLGMISDCMFVGNRIRNVISKILYSPKQASVTSLFINSVNSSNTNSVKLIVAVLLKETLKSHQLL